MTEMTDLKQRDPHQNIEAAAVGSPVPAAAEDRPQSHAYSANQRIRLMGSVLEC